MDQICGAYRRGGGQLRDHGGKTFKAMPGWGTHFDYAVFTSGDDSVGRTVCSMACVALNAAKVYYEEKHDKAPLLRTSSRIIS